LYTILLPFLVSSCLSKTVLPKESLLAVLYCRSNFMS
jgi:hypothetical protein